MEFKTQCTEGYYGFWGFLLRRSSCCSPIISDEQQTIYIYAGAFAFALMKV